MPADVAIEASGLRKSYGDVQALDGVDLSAPTGTVLALLGPNGAGKTTAVRILTTLLRPDGGSARVAGLDVERDAAELRAQIGLAGQYAAVDENLTGAENLEMVGRLYHLPKGDPRTRAAELLEHFGLTDAADRLVRTYSGGMRRRLDLAAALVARPPVLFLDEPTTGLDPRSRLELWQTIEDRVAAGTTVLLTTQYLDEADRLADRIAVIDRGRLLAEGTSFGGFVTALGLSEDLKKGLVDRFRSLPMSRAAVLAGRTLADVATNLVSLAIMIAVGLIAGFSFDAPASHVVAGIGLMLLFGYAFSWVFAFVGLVSSSPESSQAFGFIIIFPLTFVSSAFVPVDSMPATLQAFAEVNPFTITVDAMRALFLGAPAGNSIWGALLWSLGIAAVFATLSVNRYKRAVSR